MARKKWVFLPLCMVLCLFFAGCNMSSGNGTQGGSSAAESRIYATGEPAEYKGITVTLTDVKESSGSTILKPDEGKTYVILGFEVNNQSEEEISISSIMSFDSYVDDQSLSISMSALGSTKNSLDGTIAPGKKMVGSLGYEVPQNWQKIEVFYTPDLLDDTKLAFVASHPA